MRKSRRKSAISKREEEKAQKLIRIMCIILLILALMFIAMYAYLI